MTSFPEAVPDGFCPWGYNQNWGAENDKSGQAIGERSKAL